MPLIIRDNPSASVPDAEIIRKRYLSHEASIQSIGSLFLLGTVVVVPLAIAGLLGFHAYAMTPLLCVFWLVIGGAQGWVGWHLRKLDPRSKVGATLLAGLGLLAFPIGTIINAYILYLLHSAKGKYVFSPEYRVVIEATPQIRYKMSIIVWAFIWLVIGMLLLAVIGGMYGKH